jgi:hydrogenase maturation factor HypE
MSVWNKADGLGLRYGGTAWSGGELTGSSLRIGGVQVVGNRLPAIASPSGGTIIDAEARAAISAVIAALMSHGLID